MRIRSLFVGVVAAVGGAAGRADVPVPVPLTPAANTVPVRVEVPPLTLPPMADDPATLTFPSGTPVSQPLRPVNAREQSFPSAAPAPVVAEKPPADELAYPLPASWDKLELLFWWAKAHPLPPLVTASRVPTSPALGGANTTLLVGGRSLDSQDAAGGRFTLGWAANDARTVGVEAT